MFEIRMRLGPRAVAHLAPYAALCCLGAVISCLGLAAWGSDERSAAVVVAGLALALVWGLPGWRKWRVLSRNVVTLRLGPDGIEVAHGVIGQVRYACLSWDDCAAVVACRLPRRVRMVPQYVGFLPVDEDRVAGDRGATSIRQRARLLGLSHAHALMTWLDPLGQRPGADEVLAEVRRLRPDLPVRDLRQPGPTTVS